MVAVVGLALAGWAQAEQASLPTIQVVGEIDNATLRANPETLARKQAKDIRDIFNDAPGITVGGGGLSAAQKVYIRGLEDTLLNVTIDGATQSGNLYHHQSRLMIDPALVEKVEVEKGTASATAGPGALAGAVRVQTRNARDLLQPGERVGARLSQGWQSNEGWRSSALVYGRFTDTVDAMLSYSRQQNHDYEDGNGQRQINSASQRDSWLAKLNWQPSARQQLTLSHNHERDKGVRNQRPNMVAWATNQPLPQTLERDTTTVSYRQKEEGGVPGIQASLYHTQARSTRQTTSRLAGEEVASHGMDVTLESTLGRHRLQYGLNWREDHAQALSPVNRYNASVTNGADNRAEEDSRVAGLFVEDKITLGEQWQLALGLRHDRYAYKDNHSQTYRSSGWSPSGALTFAPNDDWLITASSARSLRGVGLKEGFDLDTLIGGEIVRNLPNQKAERAQKHELEVQYQADGWKVGGSVFRQRIDNYVAGLDDGRGNSGAVRIRGFELGLQYSQARWNAGVSLSRSKPEWDGRALADYDFGLGSTYGKTLLANASYRFPAQRVELGWNGKWVTALRYTPYNGKEQVKPGYNVHDVYVRWQPVEKEKLFLTLTVQNLFNKAYYDHATYGYHAGMKRLIGLPEPGRSIRLDASWQF
ncbi:TonB-dependent receptor domain-containing protein [Leeia sp.]|uniref:TonB-dependent receptor domain-containing protein n=1 Tax=Leeia sp. TaxID=2884678 RepID=UPI0035AF0350